MAISYRHFLEFIAGGAGPTLPANLALNSLGITPLASSTYPGGAGYFPLNAFDATDATANRWNSDISIPVGEWLGVDFGSAKTISKVRILQLQSGYSWATQWKVQVADNAAFTVNLRDVYTGFTPTNAALADSGVLGFAPDTGRYWRVICTASQGSANGWGIYTLELYGVGAAVPDPQTLDLPLLSDADTLFAPTLIQNQPLALPLLDDPDILFGPALAANQPLALPLLTDADILFAPTVSPDQALALPLLDDPDLLFSPSLGAIAPVSSLLLPLLADPDVLFGPTLVPGGSIIVPPLLDEADVLFGPVVVAGVSHLDLPFLADPDTLYPLIFLTHPYTIAVRLSHRYWHDDNPGPSRYYVGQTVGLVATFLTAVDSPWNPDAVRFEVRAPDGTITQYGPGDNAITSDVNGVWECEVRPSIPGTWWFRASADDAAGLSHPTAEARFRVRRSKFTGLG
jgi:hypothetical protein